MSYDQIESMSSYELKHKMTWIVRDSKDEDFRESFFETLYHHADQLDHDFLLELVSNIIDKKGY